MQSKCKKCGELYNVELIKYMKVLWRRKMSFMCGTCEGLIDWRKNKDINQVNRNSFNSKECVVECYDNRLHGWIYEKIIEQNNYCELRLRNDIT